MTHARYGLIALIAAAILLTGYATALGDLCCTLKKERFDDYPLFPNWGVGNTVVRAQSFTPQEAYELCGVSLMMSSSGACSLFIQGDPTATPTMIYASGTGSASGSEGWVFFDTEPDIMTAPGETLYLRLNNGWSLWRKAEQDYDAYPRGYAFEDGMACDGYDVPGGTWMYHDFWFITQSWEECQQPDGGIRIYLEADPNHHVHEIHPTPSSTFDVYVCLDCFPVGEGTRGTAFLLLRTFGGFKLAQTSLLGGLDFGDAETDGWTIAAGSDCVYPDADGVVCVGVITYLYLGPEGTLDIVQHPGSGCVVLDCDFDESMCYCVHANLGVSMPPNPGDPDCECGPSPVENTSWGGIKALFR